MCIITGLKVYLSWQGEDVFVSSEESVEKLVRKVTCSDDYLKEQENFPGELI